MSDDTTHEFSTHDAIDHAGIDADRYSSVAVDHDETIIYDQQVEEAWIQSDAIGPLQEWI